MPRRAGQRHALVNVKNFIYNVTYELLFTVTGIWRLSDKFFLRDNETLEDWLDWGELTRYCLPRDGLGHAVISINTDHDHENVMIRLRLPNIILTGIDNFFINYEKKVRNLLVQCCDEALGRNIHINLLKVQKIQADLRYSGEVAKAMTFFSTYPYRGEIADNFECLTGFKYIRAYNGDTFGFSIKDDSNRDTCHLNAYRGKMQIVRNVKLDDNLIFILQEFLSCVVNLKRRLEFENFVIDFPLTGKP